MASSEGGSADPNRDDYLANFYRNNSIDLIAVATCLVFTGVEPLGGDSAGQIGITSLLIFIGITQLEGRSAGHVGATNLLVSIGG